MTVKPKNVELMSSLLERTAECMTKDLKNTLLQRCNEHKNSNNRTASLEAIVYSACQQVSLVNKAGRLSTSSSNVTRAE